MFAEERYNEQFQQGMVDQFACIRDSELVVGSQYVEDTYHKMYNTCARQLDTVAQEYPGVADHVRRYSTELRKKYEQYVGTRANGTAATAV